MKIGTVFSLKCMLWYYYGLWSCFFDTAVLRKPSCLRKQSKREKLSNIIIKGYTGWSRQLINKV